MGKENFSVARVETRTRSTVGKFERHIERKNESYENMNVDLSRTRWNVIYQGCGEQTYNERLDELVAAGTVSLKGLKPDAKVFDEMVLDVNTEYFEQRGGYEYACRFYEAAFHFAQRVYGEENIISAVMHADELNVAMTEKYGRPIYHYHLHVTALPVVDKEVRWTKRCKDPALVGTVKEVIHQVSHSKKWKSVKAVDEDGKPILNSKGKPTYHASYSVLQDQFFAYMQEAGFAGFERGERGSTAEHLAVTRFKVGKEQQRLARLEQSVAQEKRMLTQLKSQTQEQRKISATFSDIDSTGNRGLFGKVSLTAKEAEELKTMAKSGVSAQAEVVHLREQLHQAQREVSRWREAYYSLYEQTREFLEAMKYAPERLTKLIRDTIREVLLTARKERERVRQSRCRSPMRKSKPKERDEGR